ncbi:hypothetical protein [Streptomyces sp. NPDC007856]|uniref:hypothetical protein n=1 Tax=Streptomyces sp. NPDC007856 TaxID=3364781 RepID=UPI003684B3F2
MTSSSMVGALAHHGLRLSEAGQHTEAVSATTRAVSLSRGLAAHHHAAHRDHLAFALARDLADADAAHRARMRPGRPPK